ncbi:MAG: hypothetical protein ACLQVI_31120 [Polyangiaceae bacterium]
MKSKKSHAAAAPVGTAANSATSPLTPVGGADPLPSTGAPTPPVEDNPVAVDPRKGLRAIQGEVDVAANAANELRSSTTFSELLSARLGTADSIANALEFAVAWYREAQAGTTWNSYAREQSNLAWAYTLAMIDRLRAGFQAVASADPAIEKEMPNFTQLLNARKVVAQKAVSTKRKIASGEIVVNKAAKPPRKSTKVSAKAKQTATAATPAPAPVEASPAPAPVSQANGVTPSANGAATSASH